MAFVVELFGQRYMMLADPRVEGSEGFIATPEQFQRGIAGFAHLFEDGRVKRYGAEIAIREDIRVLGEMSEPELLEDFWENIADDTKWRRPL